MLNPLSTDCWLAKAGSTKRGSGALREMRKKIEVSPLFRLEFVVNIFTIQFGINFYYEGLLAGEWLELLLHESSHYQFC